MDTEPIAVEQKVNAPAEQVWKAITDKEQMQLWYFDFAEFRPEVGFTFQFTGGTEENTYLHLSQITKVEENSKLTYSWRYEGYEGNSFVTFELFPEGASTTVKLTHTGLETFPKGNPDFAKSNFVAGWNHLIGISLPEFLEKKG